MKNTRLPTPKEIDQLTAYLPRLYAEGFSPVIKWEGGTPDKNGVIHMPYPQYDPLTEEFFHLLGNEHWLDYNYVSANAGEMLEDENLVRTASLAQVKTMLTFCVRGERFSDGHWETAIKGGYIRRLLERLIEINKQKRP